MTKQNKILLGVGVAGLAAYFLLRKKKSFTNFTTIDYNKCVETETAAWNAKVRDCMAQNPTSGEEKCCVVIGGNFINGSCKPPVDPNQVCCVKLGGTLNGTNCTDPAAITTCPPNEVLVNGNCTCPSGYHWEIITTSTGGEVRNCVKDQPASPSAEQIKCTTEQGGIWYSVGPDNPQAYCGCPRGTSMLNNICTADAVSEDVAVDNPPDTTTTTIVTPPPFFPGLSNLPTLGGSADSGGGGGATDDKPETDLFDWIPWILAGMTTALSVVSEQKQA